NFGHETNAPGLMILAGSSTVRGLVLNDGLDVEFQINGGNIVEGNFFGTDVSGSVARYVCGSARLYFGPDSHGNRIGGVTFASRNVISAGFTVSSGSNVVQGNFI